MKANFLCHRHRNWLLRHPELAQSIWFNNYEQACQLVEEENFSRATAFAGCAMEAADIAMRLEPLPSPELVEQYTHTCALLRQLMDRTRTFYPHRGQMQASYTLH